MAKYKKFNKHDPYYCLSDSSYLYNMPTNLVLFDGVCNLCNSSVQLLLRIDKENRLTFGSFQSDTAQSLLKQHGINKELINSIVFIRQDKIYMESTAILQICHTIGGWWKIIYLLMLIPPFIRNGIYHIIARNRYRWFGKRESCMIPSPSLKSRFID
jgi:predicted DCC family thiol-disulfide oxidoreductase YuxK